ncbi:pentatricopeptide repeat-containing protein At2g45350, chloroplastic-like [Selaginella moellendorffii]|uniref:pentatricopeptide repeat-containing protein At2g45350, chloroplastic-like n=1 Tax=Selaginella moellendorffii TaxID=88036 RepID=UPI000D1CC953|nr:pentatricopeptide repeat-containing protein At2g45350, chloroplastic-like [Selaginella moellendorffii]|eukprot:XP_024536956.1 pentatricopeptide repeat-containing protein At2g45350, chloroplastic-like [Selaginella moellendorffii]
MNSSPIDQTKDFFDLIPEKIVAWNTMLTTYADNGHLEMAISMFDSMGHHDIVSYTAMVTAYGSSGQIEHARIVFDSSPQKDVVLSTAMLAAYAHLGFLAEASTIFQSMREHNHVEFYVSCSRIEQHNRENAVDFRFDAVPDRVVPWNTMLAAHGTSCQDPENLLWAANLQGVAPDAVSFVSILGAFGHTGDVDSGWSYLVSMRSDYSIQPEKLHFGCMVASWELRFRPRSLLDNMPFVPGIEQLSCLTLF